MKKKITSQNIKEVWEEAIQYHELHELEHAIILLTHWVDQSPKDKELANDVRIVLAAANHVLHEHIN